MKETVVIASISNQFKTIFGDDSAAAAVDNFFSHIYTHGFMVSVKDAPYF